MLTIKRVTLENFCQHEHLELEMPVGLTGLVGPNGAGKSTCTHAIRGALTGTFERHTGDTAAGCIRQGQDGHASVSIQGELAGTAFRLHREITPKTIKHRLWINDKLYSEKAREIELWLTEASGLTPTLMSEFMFIRQQELYSFLDATDTERSKKFTALCGTKVYEKLRDEYVDMLKADKAKFDTVNNTIIEQLEQQILTQEAKVAQAIKGIDTLRQEAVESHDEKFWLDQLSAGQKDIQRLTDYEKLLKQIVRETSRISALKEEKKKDEKELQQSQAQLNEVLKQIKTVCEHANTNAGYGNCLESMDKVTVFYAKAVKQQEEYSRLKNAAQSAQDKYDQVKEDCFAASKKADDFFKGNNLDIHDGVVANLKDKLAGYNEHLAAVSERKRNLAKFVELVDEKNDSPHCPLCRADKEHWKVPLQSLREQLQQFIDEETELKGISQEISAQITARSKIMEEYFTLLRVTENLELKLDHINSGLEEAKVQYFTFRDNTRFVDGAKEKHEELTALLTQQGQWENNIQRIGDSVKQSDRLLVSIDKQIDDLRGQRDGMAVPWHIPPTLDELPALREQREADVLSYQKRRENARELDNEINRLLGSKEESVRHLLDLRARLGTAKALQEQSGDVQQWFEYCDKALLWLRKDGLPKLVHASVLRQLCSVVNEELFFFDNPFKVEVGEDLSFVAYFEDERVIPSKALSGGQKVMLALSFWSAVSRVFAKNLGVMILDEPTDGLDADNNERLYSIMQRWRTLLHQRGQQVIIITHDEGMSSVFDQIIQL
jgi:DNA repair exonuclease SbcCD ATPase subunit